MNELTKRPDPATEFRRQAALTIRRQVREALEQACHEPPPAWPMQIEELEDAVCRALAERKVAWALAYLAGVTMAPEVLRAAEASLQESERTR